MDAVDLEFIPLQAVTQLFQRKFRAVEDGLKADLAVEHKVSRRVGGGVPQLHRGVGDVHIDDGVVLLGLDFKRKAILCEGDFQVIFRAACRLVEFEGGRAQAHAALLHGSVLVDNEFAAVILVPRCRNGGREQRRPAGKLKGGAVCTLVITVDEGGRVFLVLPLQRRKRRVIRHVFHRHAAAAGKNGQPLGVDGGIDLVRIGGHLLRQFLQVAEAPEEVGGSLPIILRRVIHLVIRPLISSSNITLTAHKGILRFAAGLDTDKLRQIDTDRIAAGTGDLLPIVIRQAHKGIGPGVTVHIRLGDVNAVLIARPGTTLGNSLCIQILHGRGDGGTFRGDRGSRSI